jgi:hypothetical protein
MPALGWPIEIGGKAIVFSGDTNGEGDDLVRLAKNADLFIAHNAVPEGATGVERRFTYAAFCDRANRSAG